MTLRRPTLGDRRNRDERRDRSNAPSNERGLSERGDSSLSPPECSSNILLSAPPLTAVETDTCAELMDVADPCEMNVLVITYTRDPDRWLVDFRAHFTDEPENLKIVSADQMPCDGTARTGRADGTGKRTVETIESPRDLTGLGIQITKFFQHIEEADENNGTTETVICFDSLTTLLQSVDRKQAYRFLYFMTNRLSASGVTAHYHIHPDTLDDQTANTMRTLCDTLVVVGEDSVEEVVVR